MFDIFSNYYQWNSFDQKELIANNFSHFVLIIICYNDDWSLKRDRTWTYLSHKLIYFIGIFYKTIKNVLMWCPTLYWFFYFSVYDQRKNSYYNYLLIFSKTNSMAHRKLSKVSYCNLNRNSAEFIPKRVRLSWNNKKVWHKTWKALPKASLTIQLWFRFLSHDTDWNSFSLH